MKSIEEVLVDGADVYDAREYVAGRVRALLDGYADNLSTAALANYLLPGATKAVHARLHTILKYHAEHELAGYNTKSKVPSHKKYMGRWVYPRTWHRNTSVPTAATEVKPIVDEGSLLVQGIVDRVIAHYLVDATCPHCGKPILTSPAVSATGPHPLVMEETTASPSLDESNTQQEPS